MIKLGISDMAKAYVGSSEVSKMYLGSELVYSNGEVLPYDAEVEYLQSDGLVYINTGIKCASTTSFYLSFTLPDDILSNTINACLFGGRVSGSSGNMSVFMGIVDDTSHCFRWRYYGTDKHTTSSMVGGNTYVFSNLSSANVLSINNINTTITNTTFSTSVDMYLFTINANGSAWAGIDGIRFNGGQLYSNDVMVRDYIPVRKNGVGYLYDKVSGELFGNANSVGAFTYGNDI